MSNSKPSKDLLNARRDLEDLPGVELLEDLKWYTNGSVGVWVLHCRLTPGHTPRRYLPASTEWYVTISPSYPYGEIRFYPASQNSIERTFHHQLYNARVSQGQPWRPGDICRYSPNHRLGRHVADPEPLDAWHRLAWHFERALQWLNDAANDRLVLPGEPFEMPHYPSSVGLTLVYAENAYTMAALPTGGLGFGYATLFGSTGMKGHVFIRSLRSASGDFSSSPSWGRYISHTATQDMKAIWIMLNGPQCFRHGMPRQHGGSYAKRSAYRE